MPATEICLNIVDITKELWKPVYYSNKNIQILSSLEYLEDFKEGLISNISSCISTKQVSSLYLSRTRSLYLYVRLSFYLDTESEKNIKNFLKKEFGLSECES